MSEHDDTPESRPTPAGPPGPPPTPGTEPTAPLWADQSATSTAATAPIPPISPVAPAPAPAPRKKRRAGLAVAAVASTLVLAGAAGYGGAALYDEMNDDTTSSSIFSSSGSSTSTGAAADAPAGSIQAVASSVLPSVVKIEVAGSSESGSGSGIILSADGTILTNHHVVSIVGKTGKIRVDFNDGSSASATVLGTDPLTDTAVIKADKTGLKPANIGSSDSLSVGQGVVAIGSPYGLDSTVTSGIVSALNRPVNVGSDEAGNSTVYPAIQTDAAINPGNSGGALANMDGEVVGINASIRTASSATTRDSGSIGLGFAIPIDEVKPIVQQMINGETPTHARLGIKVSAVGATTSAPEGQGGQGGQRGEGDGSGGFVFPFGQEAPGQQPSEPERSVSPFTEPGAQVQEVSSGSTAEKGGLKKGDIITKVDDHQILGSDSLVATIRAYRPGDKVSVTYTRGDKETTVELTLDSDAPGAKS